LSQHYEQHLYLYTEYDGKRIDTALTFLQILALALNQAFPIGGFMHITEKMQSVWVKVSTVVISKVCAIAKRI
jgi:hypothetical protein